jgi:putative membrane protein
MTRTIAGLTAILALLAAWVPWSSSAHGTLAGHMLQHLVVMNGAALLLAVAMRPRLKNMLAASTVLQIVLLWGWHLPPVYASAHHDLLLTMLMQASLLAVSFLFWSAVLAHGMEKSWQSILAALVTAKAFCLFGAVLCFARRPFYMTDIDDQQLAGLLMMASCAVVYVVAAVLLFLRWMNDMGRKTGPQSWRPAGA